MVKVGVRVRWEARVGWGMEVLRAYAYCCEHTVFINMST